MKRHAPQHGFIALISILIISSVLLVTTLGLAQFGIANRFFILNLEQKASSKKLAEGCVQVARIQTYNDPIYVQNTSREVPIGTDKCTIVSINPDGDETTIKATAKINSATTNLLVLVDNSSGDFLSWEEVPAL